MSQKLAKKLSRLLSNPRKHENFSPQIKSNIQYAFQYYYYRINQHVYNCNEILDFENQKT